MGRFRWLAFARSVSVCAVALSISQAALAQTAADQDDNRAANDFFRAMSGRIVPGSPSASVSVKGGRAEVGYYRIRINALPAQPPSEQTKGCKAAIASLNLPGDGQLLDVIFNRRYDLGLSVSLPMELKAPGAAGAPEKRAEVNLFRLTQSGGKRCAFSLSYFERQGDYTGPWIPIDHQATALPQEAVIKFRPWVSREGNKARVDAFWTGLGGFVNLIGGPLPGIGAKLFGGGKDDYEIKGQANASIFSFTQDIKSSEPPEATRPMVVNPTGGTTFTPKSLQFNWDLPAQGGGEPFTYKMSFTIDVQYWASRLFPKDENPKFPDLSTYSASDFTKLLGLHDVPGGIAWNAIGPGVATLTDQGTPDKFQIACRPAFAELASLGFSREDQVLIVYGTAVSKGFTSTQLRSINCLFGAASATEVTEKIGKFHIAAPVVEDAVTYPASKPDDWYKALLVSVTAFNAPSVIDMPGSNFRKYLAAQIRVGGDTKLITSASATPVLADAATPYSISKADLLKALARARPMVAGCYAPRKSAAASPITFSFPDLSGLAPSSDRSLAYLAESDGKVFMVVLGVAGLNKDLDPVIDQIWFGDTIQPSDTAFRSVVADMLSSTDSSCVTRPSFKAFLDGSK